MQTQKLKTVIMALGSLLAVAVLSSPVIAATEKAAQVTAAEHGPVVALVNDLPIYKNQLTPLVEANLRPYRKQGATAENLSEDLVKGFEKKALQQVIATELVYQEACKLEIADLEERVARAIAHRQARKTGAAATESDLNLADLARREVIISEYLKQNGLRSTQVPEAEVKAYYDTNKGNLASIADEAWVRHILISVTEDASEETREKARESIEKARQLILDGTPFEEVAKVYSEDFTAERGGYLGKLQRGFMPVAFDETAFSIELNTLSDVVQTEHGYHFLEVLARYPKGHIPAYEQSREFIAKYLQPGYANRALADHVKSLGLSAKIENFL